MNSTISVILVIAFIASYWYWDNRMDATISEVEETMYELVEIIEQRTELLNHRTEQLNRAYTDIATLQAQQTVNEEYYKQQIEQAMFAFYYVPTAQRYGAGDLQDYLQRWQWKEGAYVEDNFDCSQMSAYLERDLENEGYHTFIVGGESPDGSGRHAWLLVETSEGKYTPVEATSRSTVDHRSSYFDNYFRYEFHFETIEEALSYHPREYKWWN